MTYPIREASVDDGRPLYFYEFWYGDTQSDAHRYVADTEQTLYAGRMWAPMPIRHSEIVVSGSLDKQTLTVTAREDIEITALVVTRPPSRITTLHIFRGHIGDDDARMIWSGRVLSGTLSGTAEVELSCEPISTSQLSAGMRRKYQRGCPHALYKKSCGLDQSLHTETGSTTAVVNSMTVDVTLTGTDRGMTAAALSGGIFRVKLENGMTEIRAISSATKGEGRTWRIKLIAPIYDMGTLRPVSISKGCLHTYDACKTFNNTDNFGGCLNVPVKSPFAANQF